MKKAYILITALALLAASPLSAEEIKLGQPINVQEVTLIRDLNTSPEKYLGKSVRVEGRIAEVCQMAGCWITIRDESSDDLLQVKVDDGVIVFPKNGAGKRAVVQGKVEKLVQSKEEYIEYIEHQAAESGREVDTSKVTAGRTFYRLRGQGAVIWQ